MRDATLTLDRHAGPKDAAAETPCVLLQERGNKRRMRRATFHAEYLLLASHFFKTSVAFTEENTSARKRQKSGEIDRQRERVKEREALCRVQGQRN